MWTLYQKLDYCINFTVSISSDPSFSNYAKGHAVQAAQGWPNLVKARAVKAARRAGFLGAYRTSRASPLADWLS